jgi:uncharacterized protein YggE
MTIDRQTCFLCLFTITLLANPLVRADESEDRVTPSMSVNGTGKVAAVPDVAEINVGVVTQARTAQEAVAMNAESMTTLHRLLKELGVASKDIETTQFQIAPVYSQPEGPGGFTPDFQRKIVGFQATNMLHITARKIEKLGSLLDALVSAGANQIHSLGFRVENPEKLLDEARRKAMADAKRTADLLAGEAGVVLGPPLKISEASRNVPGPWIPARFAGGGPAMMAAPTPIAAGEQELSVTVQVVYQLKQPKS